MKVENFINPVNPENPCGELMEYDLDFQLLEQSFSGKDEQQYGNTIIPATSPDWGMVENMATELLKKTKDIRVLTMMTHAWTHRYGLEGYADGMGVIYASLVKYWDSIYPQLDSEGEYDPFERINALQEIGDKSALAILLGKSLVISDTTFNDIFVMLRTDTAAKSDHPEGKRKLIDDVAKSKSFDVISQIHQCLRSLKELFEQKFSIEDRPNIDSLFKMVSVVYHACINVDRPEDGNDSQEIDGFVATNLHMPIEPSFSKISSRKDVRVMLEMIQQYFIENEPSHAAPLLIERLQKILELNFIEMVRELAPDGYQQLDNTFGQRE